MEKRKQTMDALLREATAHLMSHEVPDASIDAWYLMEDVFEIDRAHYLMDRFDLVSDIEKIERFEKLVEKRAQGVPVQYLTGKTEFMGLPFMVSEAVLIPRQDTEVLVETALGLMKPDTALLDMCTGSGCILLSLAKLGSVKSAAGADISQAALEIAEKNRENLGLEGVKLIHSDLFENINEKYDMIVSNPPYIPSAVVDTLMREVREHEPRLALDGTEDGLFFYRKIVKEAGAYLNADGFLIFEIGHDQGQAVSNLMREAGYLDIKVIKDLAGLDRVVCGRKNV